MNNEHDDLSGRPLGAATDDGESKPGMSEQENPTNRIARPDAGEDWRPIETSDFNAIWLSGEMVLVHTVAGLTTTAKALNIADDTRIWVGLGDNLSDPRWPSKYLRDTVTHWMPLPPPPKTLSGPDQKRSDHEAVSEGSRAEPHEQDLIERLREPIARIISPTWWNHEDRPVLGGSVGVALSEQCARNERDNAFSKADEILALLARSLLLTPLGGK